MRPLRFRGALKAIWRPPGGDLSAFGGLLGGFSGRIESSVSVWRLWKAIGGLWEASGDLLEVTRRLSEASGGALVGVLGALGIVLKASRQLLSFEAV